MGLGEGSHCDEKVAWTWKMETGPSCQKVHRMGIGPGLH